MGEVAPSEKKVTPPEEGKTEEAPPAPPQEDENKSKEEAPAPPPPPREIVLKVFMHCEACARKVRRCLRGFEGVEDVIADCRASKVVVKGEKADPVKVLERVQRKSHRKVDLISPIPKPPSPDKPPVAKSDDKKEEPPAVITVVLRVYMHCDACAQEIKRRIRRMKGVESAEPDLKGSQVTVKGVLEPQKLVDYVYKRTGKHAVILKVVEPEKEEAKEEKKPEKEEAKEEKKPEKDEAKEEKKADEGEKEAKKDEEAAKEGDGGDGAVVATDAKEPAAKPDVGEDSKLELKKNEFYYYHPQNYQMYPPRFVQEMNAYPPQIFSDENPNACSVM